MSDTNELLARANKISKDEIAELLKREERRKEQQRISAEKTKQKMKELKLVRITHSIQASRREAIANTLKLLVSYNDEQFANFVRNVFKNPSPQNAPTGMQIKPQS